MAKNPPVLKGGMAPKPEAPGLGVDLDDSGVKEWQREGDSPDWLYPLPPPPPPSPSPPSSPLLPLSPPRLPLLPPPPPLSLLPSPAPLSVPSLSPLHLHVRPLLFSSLCTPLIPRPHLIYSFHPPLSSTLRSVWTTGPAVIHPNHAVPRETRSRNARGMPPGPRNAR